MGVLIYISKKLI